MDRTTLIARKHEVQRRRERAQAELARLDAAPNQNAAGPQRNRRRIAELQQQIEQLQAEEFNLRLAIDRATKPD